MRKYMVLWSLLMKVPRENASLQRNIWRMLRPRLSNRARTQERETCQKANIPRAGVYRPPRGLSCWDAGLPWSTVPDSGNPAAWIKTFFFSRSSQYRTYLFSLSPCLLLLLFSSLISLKVISQCQLSPCEVRPSLLMHIPRGNIASCQRLSAQLKSRYQVQ